MENTFIQGNAKDRTVKCQWVALLMGDSLTYQSDQRQNGKNKVEINNKQVFKSLSLNKLYVKV